MRPRFHRRLDLISLLLVAAIAGHGCNSGSSEPEAASTPGPAVSPIAENPLTPSKPPENKIAPEDLGPHFQGLGYMEQFKYREAVNAFREVRRRAPGWIPGSINLAIALLNDTGEQAEKAKKSGGAPEASNFDEALKLLAEVLEREPNNPYGHFCSGIILEQLGKFAEAHEHFKKVTEIDSSDGAAWYWTASTLPDKDEPTQPAGPRQASDQMKLLEKALELNPYLVPAIYKMYMASRFTGNPQLTKELRARFDWMNPDRSGAVPGPGDTADKVYGEMGKYASVVNPFAGVDPSRSATTPTPPPRFEAAQPLKVTLAPGEAWVKPGDFVGPLAVIRRIRERFGAAVAAFDVNGDDRPDLYLAAAARGPKGVHDVLLLNQGEGRFDDASARFGLPGDRASLGVAAADFDADRHIDVFLTGVGTNLLLRNRDGSRFEDISSNIKMSGSPALSLMARWLDLDQDGDLDLYVVNHCAAEHADKAFTPEGSGEFLGLANVAYRNDGQPTPVESSPSTNWAPAAVAIEGVRADAGLSIVLTPWPDAPALSAGTARHSGLAAIDLDDDRDLDLVIVADDAKATAVLNDRGGRFHSAQLDDLTPASGFSGLLAVDLDADGRADLVAPSATGAARAWRNLNDRSIAKDRKFRFETWPMNAKGWRSAQGIDLDLDGLPDLLGLPAPSPKTGEAVVPMWARNEGSRAAAAPLAILFDGSGIYGLAAIDLIGDPLPDALLLPAGAPPALAKNLGNGQHWLALDLKGHWKARKVMMRTNSHGIGARVLVEGQGTHATHENTTPESGLAQSIAPFVVGLGKNSQTDLVHIKWPDGVSQCELNVTGDQKLEIAENNRKTSSCPVLFTWNGNRFVCIADFLGGGGLGYLVAPGVYGAPDRDEAVAISADQLQPTGGVFRMSITEPMDEVSYIDRVTLDVVDRPPGVFATPDERFAPEGPRPTGELVAWRSVIRPKHATDLAGHDVTEILRDWDRRTVDQLLKLEGWIGYTAEHGIVLDFGDQLARFGPKDPLVLCLAGWVEYPYSQTNYAAATAGVKLTPPAIERKRDDGTWEVIEPHAGYPAGLPRLMTLDLSGKLTGKSCVLRIKTSMECYYDQAFIAIRDRAAETELRVTTLDVSHSTLQYRGYTREISPDGKQPLIYDYDYVDPAPLARFAGKLTRYGDVAPLLRKDDDQLCLVGPGDEARIEFDATKLPPLPAGWSRQYVLRTIGYCKDADPFTAISDTIEPLPWRDMPPFPFAPEIRRPSDPAYETYLKIYQTRPAGRGD
jgi:tetratricopeptide (TPR) repeat protein